MKRLLISFAAIGLAALFLTQSGAISYERVNVTTGKLSVFGKVCMLELDTISDAAKRVGKAAKKGAELLPGYAVAAGRAVVSVASKFVDKLGGQFKASGGGLV